MVNMENAEEVMQILERFTRLKQKEIPKELDDYLQYVAKTGDTVFKWASLKYLFREKLLNVIKHFHDTAPRVEEIPQYPNVDPFNYESMKSSLLERLELFNAAPFTIQRLCELLIDPRKQYSRIDKFMRALEKNILVVSTIEPGRKRTESENGDSLDSVVNGDLSLDVNVDIDMENEPLFNMEAQNGTNGNGAVVAADADASNGAEAESEPAKDKAASGLLHGADDDILPNPKKAKLDPNVDEEAEKQVDQKQADAVAAGSGGAINAGVANNEKAVVLKVVAVSEAKVEKVDKEKQQLDSVEKEKGVEEPAELVKMNDDVEMSEKEKNVEIKESDDKKPLEKVDEKKVEMEQEEIAAIEQKKEPPNKAAKEVAEAKPKAKEQQQQQDKTEVDANCKTAEVSSPKVNENKTLVKETEKKNDAAADIAENGEKIIVEKQEIEKGEKEQVEALDAKRKTESDAVERKKDAGGKVEDNKSPHKVEIVANETIKAVVPEVTKDESAKENDMNKEKGDKEGKKEPSHKTTDTVKEKEPETNDNNKLQNDEKKATTTKIEAAKIETAKTEVVKEQKNAEAAEKTENIVAAEAIVVKEQQPQPKVEEKAAAEAKPTPAVAKANIEEDINDAVVVAKELKLLPATTAAKAAPEATATNTEIATATTTATATEAAAAATAVNEIVKDLALPEPTLALTDVMGAVGDVAIDAVAGDDLTPTVVTVTATEAAVDQPMEDVPLDDLVAAAAVDEVMMAETTAVSGSGGGSVAGGMGTAMATDEPAAKLEAELSEAAGMDVDDTSPVQEQEAMDQ